MDEWKPRRHDHLVEPVFGGLGARHEADEQRSASANVEQDSAAPASRNLLVAVVVVGALIVARIAMLA